MIRKARNLLGLKRRAESHASVPERLARDSHQGCPMTAILPVPTAIRPAPRAVPRRTCPASPTQVPAPVVAPLVTDDSPDARATRLMDEFRRTGARAVFEELAALVQPQLLARARRRCRLFGDRLDPHEVVQDTLVNVFRFPDRFEPRRAQAFRVWSSRILDNVVRRRLRDERLRVPVLLCTSERLASEVDPGVADPPQAVADQELACTLGRAFAMFLAAYLEAFETLSERERFVLQMVEVHGLRYADLGAMLGIRGDALKMVVFRSRRRIFERLQSRLCS